MKSPTKKILITGGAGFIGSHIAEYYGKKGDQVICFDNLSRGSLMEKDIGTAYNWNYLQKLPNIRLIKGDIRNLGWLKDLTRDVDVVIHTASQTAVTTSIRHPEIDFEINALGTLNVLEAARLSSKHPVIIYCSTNKVYGDNINKIGTIEKETRYIFEDKFKNGIPETFPIDSCEHTPYGCSKLTGDLYIQEYAKLYGLRTAVFRMSCIYGVRQLGVEDQGWVSWLMIANFTGRPVTIYGTGKQVRDILYVDDLVDAYDSFIKSDLSYGVFNIGGGPKNTISLLELLELLKNSTGRRSQITFSDWREGDQKVYISNIDHIGKVLGWAPKVSVEQGIEKIVKWGEENS